MVLGRLLAGALGRLLAGALGRLLAGALGRLLGIVLGRALGRALGMVRRSLEPSDDALHHTHMLVRKPHCT